MRGLVAVLLICVISLGAAREVRGEDRWLAPDKALHFGMSLAAGSLAMSVVGWKGRAQPTLGGVGVGFALGVAPGLSKEGVDLCGDGAASWRDLAWDGLGAAVGVGLVALVMWAAGVPASPAAASP